MRIDQTKLEELRGLAVAEAAAAESAACCYVGDVLGLYEAMAGAGPLTPAELAARTDTHERYVREWLANQASGGYVTHHPADGTFELLPEHAPRLYRGVERIFAPLYRHQLVQDWIPALDGVDERLAGGARVADVGCGHGASTIVLAQAYPASRFVGFDSHAGSIAAASKAAAEAGVGDRVAFEVAPADGYRRDGYDLVCFFDCLHDMGDPVAAAAHAREALADDGTLLVVEPMAGDDLADNHNPISRLFYAGSVFLCTPSSLAQDGAAGLGAQAGEARLREVLGEAGFTRIRLATQTPFNLVIEARP